MPVSVGLDAFDEYIFWEQVERCFERALTECRTERERRRGRAVDQNIISAPDISVTVAGPPSVGWASVRVRRGKGTQRTKIVMKK